MYNLTGRMELAVPVDDDDWAMLSAHNLSLQDVLVASGLGSDSRWFKPATELCLVLAFALAILLGLLGNGVLALILCRRGHLRTPRHWYLMNLVVTDILTCVLCVPFTLLRLTLKDWQLGELLCRTAPFLQLTYVFVSVFTILAIAVERYRAIVCSTHLRGPDPHQRLASVVIPAIWVLSIGLATPLAVNHRLEHVRNITGGEVILTLCVEHWADDTMLGVYTLILLIFQYALPAAAIMALHLLICRFLRTRVHLRTDSVSSRRKLTRHRKNLALLTVICITFDVEWLPITIVNIIADIDPTLFPSADDFCLIHALCLLFALTSVFVNPVVYGWYNSNFRKDLCRSARANRSTTNGETTVSAVRRSSTALSRFFASFVGSSDMRRLRTSVDSGSVAGCGPSTGRPQSKLIKRHHGSLDATVDFYPFSQQTGLKEHRMSLQCELK